MTKPIPTSLGHSPGLYRHLFDVSPDLLLTIDHDGRIGVANARIEDLLGYQADSLGERPVSELLDSASHSDFEVVLRGVREGTDMPEVEVGVLSADGRRVPMMLEVRSIEDVDDDFLVRLRDLREIRALEKEYRNLFESIADAVFIGDPETGQILQANRQAAELTGYSLGELIGQDFDKVHSLTWETVSQDLSSADEEALAGIEIDLVGKDEVRVPVEMHIGLVTRDEDQFYIETLINISDRRELERHMQDLRAEWDSFMRHELRSPLTPILAFSQMLMEDFPDIQSDARVVKYLDSIWQGGKRLERLLDMTREVQQYERGEIPMHPLKGDIYKTIETSAMDAGQGVDEALGDARIRIEREGPDPCPVVHDAQVLQRALANLMKNALEHDDGLVVVGVTHLKDEVEIHVTNRGEPIPPDRLSTIFEKFNTTKRATRGTGLGTTIARLFVEAHSGTIGVTSSEADGTTFTVRIPVDGPAPNRERKVL